VSNPLGTTGVTTNGSHRAVDAETSEPEASQSQPQPQPSPPSPDHGAPDDALSESVGDRLEALRRTIQSWDWRRDPLGGSGPIPPTDALRQPDTAGRVGSEPDPPHAHAPDMPAPAVAGAAVAGAESVGAASVGTTVSGGAAPTVLVPVAPPDPGVTTLPVPPLAPGAVGPPTPASPTVDHISPPTGPPVAGGIVNPAPPVAGGVAILPPPDESANPAPHPEMHDGPETLLGRVRRAAGSHARIALLCVVAVLAVIGIVLAIRAVSGNSNSNSGSTSTTSATHPPAVHHQPVAGITSAQLARYDGYAAGLVQANTAATKAFVAAGKDPTTVAAEVATYRAAVNLYDFQLHFIAWPASMATVIATDHAQFHALLSFLDSYSTVSTSGITAWLSQLHNRTGMAQVTDNQVRQDMGLPPTNSFP
jgi:hypothetical protein